MQYRSFGRTGWEVSEIGFGAWQLGGTWGSMDDQESVNTLLYAFEKGVNFVDTAQMYGAGHSEQVVGETLKQWSGSHIYVATKVQPVRWPMPNESTPQMRGRYPDWYLRKEVEDCLRRLQVERIDLLQLHCWVADGVHELDWLETINDLRLEGKIDQVGVSLRDSMPWEGVDLARLGLVAAQQVVFNLFEQEPARELFPAGKATKTAFIARVPFDSGALTGTFNEGTYDGWEKTDFRRKMYQGQRFEATLRRVHKLKSIINPYYDNLAEAAMRYCLQDSAVNVVIPGMRSKREVDLNTAYSDGKPFSQELLDALRFHEWKHIFYGDYACPFTGL